MEIDFPKLENRILRYWKKNRIFEKSIERRKRARDFVFYEGPPTANGRPGIHHVLSRVFKDIIPRYKTMRGFRVLRKGGWDTHGLPVELEIEKKLGLKAKKEIEKYGLAKFNKKCRQSVWEYKKEWEKLTERIAFWLDMKNPYITYEREYIESVWWILKEIYRKGLLYKDYKVVPYCPRCGTSLSSHEVALGYKTVKDLAVIVKFPITEQKFINKYCRGKPTSFLAWTTTPWSLPTTMALAIGADYNYVAVNVKEEQIICLKERLGYIMSHLPGVKYEIINEFKGKEMEHISYKHPFGEFYQEREKIRDNPNVYKTHITDYVGIEEGAGIVTINGAFGEIDMEASKKIGLPVLVNVKTDGTFAEEMGEFAGMQVKPREDRGKTDVELIKYLDRKSFLFAKEKYEHSYPFCWRCNSPLLYYAKKSWFIKMTKVKEDLIKNNQKINWAPKYIKEGRFGEWLREVRDWTLSRERYWGTPLPIWQCQIGKNQKLCDNVVVIGSKEDLLSQKFSTNNYFLFRHGHSLRQVTNLADSLPDSRMPLTKKGINEVKKAAKKIKNKKIALIFSSDILRAKETAEILAKETGAKIIFDKRLREVNVGIFNGKDSKLVWDYLSKKKNLSAAKIPKGESLMAVRKRVYDFLEKIDKEQEGKNILIVSHEFPLTVLEKTLAGLSLEEIIKWRRENRSQLIRTGHWRKVEFKKLPLNQKGELDFHRPYIDEVKFFCQKCGETMERVPEVIDCWFDSGSMPFGQAHWPFAWPQIKNEKLKIKNYIKKGFQFPADYICEGVDQTRGWFYTLLAISTLLDFGPAYKNVISLGHVLDEKGEKMSKSRGNTVDPSSIIEKYGADATRWYFWTINQPGDSKLFLEKDVEQALKKFILTFWNCCTFFETYVSKKEFSIFNFQFSNKSQIRNPKHVLDKWIISRLNSLILEATQKLDKYDITGAARAIEGFTINDLSLWYIRRSRRRFQRPENKKELQESSATLNYVLLTLSKLTAPFIPFLSEEIYNNLQLTTYNLQQSVHLEDWPKVNKKLIDKKLEENMEKVREVVAQALAERAKASIKVRQPLSKLKIKNEKLKMNDELLDLLKEEVNVKEIIFDSKIKSEVELDTKITAELKEEGIIREVSRHIQGMRKKMGLKPKDKILVFYFGSQNLNEILTKNEKVIVEEGKIKDFQIRAAPKESLRLPTGREDKKVFNIEKEFEIDRQKLWLGIKKR
ncbi:MAG: isoleucine--tRNA ligase [Candidatus Nealsonbacteria bacterium CG08_land_8_20_14_0_20_38_20]|uniref:Isoleucine--tRNA ligase n=1 Tax=Candidatus Nealsonbacteria bacterium CG08_land_8_20_14_0_20_38_20 TaxID=1974705 RepID=A0A2H0YLU6_9BACT|nr:MAG: isoleucine--tRNA ligase [Candidatus Nealsonbacteria bacterium CG08_land_8_20_14_0_20_38_20]